MNKKRVIEIIFASFFLGLAICILNITLKYMCGETCKGFKIHKKETYFSKQKPIDNTGCYHQNLDFDGKLYERLDSIKRGEDSLR